MNIRLVRFCYAPSATMGRLYLPDGRRYVYTIERPWLNNKVSESCIPEGYYRCERHNGTKYKNTWQVKVPGRTAICFHAGNTAKDVTGCIAPGMGLGAGLSVYKSGLAMATLKMELPEQFNLEVRAYRAEFGNPADSSFSTGGSF